MRWCKEHSLASKALGAFSGYLVRTSRAPKEAKLQYAFKRSSANIRTVVSFSHCKLPAVPSRVIMASSDRLLLK